MSYYRTASQMIAELRWIADIESNSVRHPDSSLLYALNTAYHYTIKLITSFGYESYCSFDTLSTAANTPYVYLDSLIATASAAGTTYNTYGAGWDQIVTVTLLTGNNQYPLRMSPSNDIDMFSQSSMPKTWQVRSTDLTDVPANTVWYPPTRDQLYLYPTPNAIYTIKIMGLKSRADVTADGYYDLKLPEIKEHILDYAAAMIALRDDLPIYDKIENRRMQKEATLRAMCRRVSEPGRKCDTRGQARIHVRR